MSEARRGIEAVQVQGLREFRRLLRQTSDELPGALRAANKQAAEIVAAAARLRAPRGEHQGGPKNRSVVPLVSSIRAYGLGDKAQVGIGGQATPYGPVVEFGGDIPRRGRDKALAAKAKAQHRSYRSAGITSTTRVRKRPYLYPAIAATRERVIEVYDAALDRLTRRAFPD